MTIYEIKRRTEETSHEFFTRQTLKFFGQTLKDFRVYKMDSKNYLIAAPVRMRGKVIGHTRRLFNTDTNKLQLED